MIEKAARALADDMYCEPGAWDVWVTDMQLRDVYRRRARTVLEAAGVLPPEPLPSTVTVEHTGKRHRPN